MTMSAIFHVRIKNDIQEMKRVIKDLNLFLHSRKISERTVYTVNLAMEEPLANIILHGHDENALVTIDIEVRINTDKIAIQLIDDGRAFNPLSIPHFDLRKPAISRPVGGLGMHIVRNIMQSMWYQRKDGRNILEVEIDRTS